MQITRITRVDLANGLRIHKVTGDIAEAEERTGKTAEELSKIEEKVLKYYPRMREYVGDLVQKQQQVVNAVMRVKRDFMTVIEGNAAVSLGTSSLYVST